jgi:magnesium chelatase family protein
MLAVISSQAPVGIEGIPIQVEVDIRRGLPGIDVVGLPDGAVREARDRVRVAIRNSGFRFPIDRILVNLSPAGIKKEGASYDLAIALAILKASEQVSFPDRRRFMVVGELNLRGIVLPVRGVLSAIASGLQDGIRLFLVPQENLREARALCAEGVFGISSLRGAAGVLKRLGRGSRSAGAGESGSRGDGEAPLETGIRGNPQSPWGDMADIKGQGVLKKALAVAAAGRHHLLLFGPPGSGKAA